MPGQSRPNTFDNCYGPQTDRAFSEDFGYVSRITQPWTGDPNALAAGTGEATADRDNHWVRTIVDRAVSPRRFFMMLVGAFASLGVLLAATGIYGVISYSVTQKTQEIGVRMALWATAGRILRDIIFNTLRLATIGIVLEQSSPSHRLTSLHHYSSVLRRGT